MPAAICCSKIVFPVRGGATISPRCPKPIGVSKSTTRMDSDPLFRAVAESTVRAVRRTRLIHGLAPEKYLLWRDMRINFDPRNVALGDLG